MRKGAFLLIALVLALLGSASDARRHHRDGGEPQDGGFDYYVLSLSWAPTFCATHRDNSDECTKPHGMVLHGLWPQYEAGGYPQTCSGRLLTPEEQQSGAALYPSLQLAAHEWARHGTCSGLAPTAYFKAAADARDSIRIPPELQAGTPSKTMRAADIVRALRDANPSLPSRAIVVSCGNRALTEVRVCLDKSLAPRACGPDVRPSCGSGPVSVPGAR